MSVYVLIYLISISHYPSWKQTRYHFLLPFISLFHTTRVYSVFHIIHILLSPIPFLILHTCFPFLPRHQPIPPIPAFTLSRIFFVQNKTAFLSCLNLPPQWTMKNFRHKLRRRRKGSSQGYRGTRGESKRRERMGRGREGEKAGAGRRRVARDAERGRSRAS